MLIKSIQIKNFRNLDFSGKFSNGVNVIVGKNGVGKSNFLDSLYYLSYTKSFKKYSERNNISYSKDVDFALIEAKIEAKRINKELKIIFSLDTNGFERKRLEIDKRVKSRGNFMGNLYLSLFAPHNINLLSGTPEMRRDELDDFISVVDHNYERCLSEYKQVVRNRNQILGRVRDGKSQVKELEFWTEKMIVLGSEVLKIRNDILKEFMPFIKDEAEVFEKHLTGLIIKYTSKIDLENGNIKDNFNQKVTENFEKEIIVGRCLYGPHRDDYDFIAGDKNLKIFASRGQQRIATMIFKTAMWHYFLDIKKVRALLLLDDIMSELDPENKKKVEKMVDRLATQTFITATDKDELINDVIECRMCDIEAFYDKLGEKLTEETNKIVDK